MILKPGKAAPEVESYRPISLLPVLSKVLEEILLERVTPTLEDQQLIPDHQFGFRQYHGTTEQIYRLVKQINSDLENKRYCSAVRIDIGHAFDKVWHTGLHHKMKQTLPHPIYTLLKSH